MRIRVVVVSSHRFSTSGAAVAATEAVTEASAAPCCSAAVPGDGPFVDAGPCANVNNAIAKHSEPFQMRQFAAIAIVVPNGGNKS